MKLFVFLLVFLGIMFVCFWVLIVTFFLKVKKVNYYISAVEVAEQLDYVYFNYLILQRIIMSIKNVMIIQAQDII